MNRQLNDNLPRIPALRTTIQPKTRNLLAERQTQKQQHDRKIFTKTTSETFRLGQRVALQDPTSKQWSIRGRIVEEVAPRSFSVRIAGTQKLLRRNRRHIRKLHSTTSTREDMHTPEQHDEQHDEQQQQTENNQHQLPTIQNNHPSELQYHEPSSDSSANDSDTDTIPYDDKDTYNTLHEGQVITRSGRAVHAKKPLDYEEI